MAKDATHMQPVDDSRLARLLGAECPQSLAETGNRIAAAREVGRSAAVDICLLLAWARTEWFPDDPSGWLTWARDEFEYDRRHCFRCLKAGMLLLTPGIDECATAHLAQCDPEWIEELGKIPPSQLGPLLKRWDPSRATRKEVREKVKLWSPDDEGDGGGKEEKARAKKKEPRRPEPGVAFERHLLEAKKILDATETADQAGDSCQSVELIELAFNILAYACQRQMQNPWWTEPMMKRIRTGLSGLNGDVAEIGKKLGY